jgi:hypothetical protein
VSTAANVAAAVSNSRISSSRSGVSSSGSFPACPVARCFRNLADQFAVIRRPSVQAGSGQQTSRQQEKKPQQKGNREQVLLLKWYQPLAFQPSGIWASFVAVKISKLGLPGHFYRFAFNLSLQHSH